MDLQRSFKEIKNVLIMQQFLLIILISNIYKQDLVALPVTISDMSAAVVVTVVVVVVSNDL